ncbi:DUF4352 domain-containing protein [Candidatus Altiarchaeota archaeon]
MNFQTLLVVFAVVCVAVSLPVCGSDLAIVANPIDSSLAADLYLLLEESDVSFILSSPEALDVDHPFILFLGGHRSPEGVGDFVTGILSGEDKEYLLSSSNSSAIFVRDDFFLEGQRVWVAAGFDEFGTQRAWMDNLNDIISHITGSNETVSREEDSPGDVGVSINDWYFADVIIFRSSSMHVLKDDPRFGNKFLLVNLTLTNYGNEAVEYFTRDFRVESDKQSFGRISLRFLGGKLKGKHLEPGESTSGMVTFEVPKRREDFVFVYSCPGILCENRIKLV